MNGELQRLWTLGRRRRLERLLGRGDTPPGQLSLSKSALASGLDLNALRAQFATLATHCYFNYGARGLLSRDTLRAISEFMQLLQDSGPFSTAGNALVIREVETVRRHLAALVGVQPDQLTLTESVSAACNTVLWGTRWVSGDRLLISDQEAPGVMLAAREVARRFGVALDVFAACPGSSGGAADAISANLRPTTKLVIVSHVLWTNGRVVELDPIANIVKDHRQKHGIVRLLVDGIQAVGVLPLELGADLIDFYAFGANKWLCAPDGIAALYSHADALDSIESSYVGWRAIDPGRSDHDLLLRTNAGRFELGSAAFAMYAGLRNSLEAQERWSSKHDRFQRTVNLARYFWSRLGEMEEKGEVERMPGPGPNAGTVCFRLPRHPCDQVRRHLESVNILMREIPMHDHLRACVHLLTTVDEIEASMEAIRELVRDGAHGRYSSRSAVPARAYP